MSPVVIVIAVLVFVGAIAWFLRGRGGPRIARRSAMATVRAKRRVEVEGRARHVVSFELDDGDREDLVVDPVVFDRVAEGARGVLEWEETRFVSFRDAPRDAPREDGVDQ